MIARGFVKPPGAAGAPNAAVLLQAARRSGLHPRSHCAACVACAAAVAVVVGVAVLVAAVVAVLVWLTAAVTESSPSAASGN